jgi:hypothetical protein
MLSDFEVCSKSVMSRVEECSKRFHCQTDPQSQMRLQTVMASGADSVGAENWGALEPFQLVLLGKRMNKVAFIELGEENETCLAH